MTTPVDPEHWRRVTSAPRHELSPAGFHTLDQWHALIMEGITEYGGDTEDPATLIAMDVALTVVQLLLTRFPSLTAEGALQITRGAIHQRARALPTPPFHER